MADKPVLLGPDGQPVTRELLTTEVAAASIGSVRSPITNYPADGLNPSRLASILKQADQGDPLAYLELAEQIEERDMHYVGVLGTRKRSVSQLEIFVDAASDDARHVEQADRIRAWLNRDELQDELFDILDAIGKGFSETEIIWDTSTGQWQPARLEHRDPRWFTFDRRDGKTPLLRTNEGDVPLQPFKFVSATIRAKSGLPIRSGIARLATWSWMFKAFTLRDWAIFTQTFGQPVRVGKYPAGSSDKDKDTLFRAVANIAGDCAAIIPESMIIEFIQAQNIGASHALYKERADWFDQQTSKAVLGQTATTDAIAGGHAVGQEHRQVQKDIERADARALAAILNRDLVQPWVQLEHGPQLLYPRLRIGKDDETDLNQLTDNVSRLVPFGLKVGKSWMNDKLGIPDPDPKEELLTAPASSSPFGGFGLGGGFGAQHPQLNAARPATMTADHIATLTQQAERLCAPGLDGLIDDVRAIVVRCSSLEEVRDELAKLKPGMAEANFAGLLRMARVVANLTGRADIADA